LIIKSVRDNFPFSFCFGNLQF